MAEAKKTNRQVIVEETYTLILSKEEANTLAAVMARVGGSPSGSPRAHIISIQNALQRVDINYYNTTEKRLMHGSIMLDTYED